MRAVRVNFAPEPAWIRRAVLGVIVLSGMFACVAGWQGWSEWRELKALDATLLQARLQQAAMRAKERELQAEFAKPKPYARDAAELVRIASFPTDLILHALEVTQVEGVRVTLIDLSPDSEIARVELEFADASQLMKYVEQINEGEKTGRWEIVQLKTKKSSGPTSNGAAVLTSAWH